MGRLQEPSSSFFQGKPIAFHSGAAGFLLIAAVIVVTLLTLARFRLDAEMRAAVTTQSMAKSVNLTFEGLIDTIDIALRASADEITRQMAAGQADGPAITRYLEKRKEGLNHVSVLRGINERGEVVYGEGILSPLVNNMDRDYFIHLRDHPNAGLFIAKPIIGRIAKKWVWLFARRINRPGGAFGGVVYALVNIDELNNIIAPVTMPAGSSIALRDADLGLLVRHTFDGPNPFPIGDQQLSAPFLDSLKANPQEGTFVSDDTSIDKNSRIYSYQHNSKYGFLVSVGVSHKAVLADWRKEIWGATALVAIFILVTMAYLRLVYSARRRQEMDMAVLEANQAALRMAQQIAGLFEFTYNLQTDKWTSSSIPEIDSYNKSNDKLWLERIISECRAVIQAYNRAKYEQLLTLNHEYSIVYPGDNQKHWVQVKGNLELDAEGVPLILHGTIHDISERKQTEARLTREAVRYQFLLKTASDGIHVLDEEGNLIEASDSFWRMLAYAPEYPPSFHVTDWDAELSRENFKEKITSLIAEPLVFETKHRRADGSLFDVEINCHGVEFEGKKYLYASSRDITERKALESNLKRINAELEDFAYVASHDLRQPLRMVTSYLGLIEKRLAPEMTDEIKTFLAYAVGGAKRMDRLISDLLQYSRTGRICESAINPLGEVVADALLNLTEAIRDADAAISVADDLPTLVGDPMELARLFENLIGNAIKYRAPGRPVRIGVGWSRRGKDYLLWVKDNGTGIAETDYDRAFMIFQRMVPKDSCEGTGMGLAICKKIVEHHGGRIWIESVVGEGSSFFMIFPNASVTSSTNESDNGQNMATYVRSSSEV